MTGWMVTSIFLDALLGINFNWEIALMFVVAMALFTTALLLFLVEINASVVHLAARSK